MLIRANRDQERVEALVIILIMVFLDTKLENAGHRNALVVRVPYARIVAKLVILASIASILEDEMMVRLV